MRFLRNLRNLYFLEQKCKILYNNIEILETKYEIILDKIAKLEEDNIENSNLIYELSNNIEALDTRIDIITAENWRKEND